MDGSCAFDTKKKELLKKFQEKLKAKDKDLNPGNTKILSNLIKPDFKCLISEKQIFYPTLETFSDVV